MVIYGSSAIFKAPQRTFCETCQSNSQLRPDWRERRGQLRSTREARCGALNIGADPYITIYHNDRRTEENRSVRSNIPWDVSCGILGVSFVSIGDFVIIDIFFRSGEHKSARMASRGASAEALRSNAAPAAAESAKTILRRF